MTNLKQSKLKTRAGYLSENEAEPLPPVYADAEYISVRQFAALLKVSPLTVYRLLRARRIEGAVKLRHEWRLPVWRKGDELDEVTHKN